jgi:hypothetical protein
MQGVPDDRAAPRCSRELEKAANSSSSFGFDAIETWLIFPSTSKRRLGARRAVQYSKGALFLAQLRESIGNAAFVNGLRGFTRRHAGGTVTSKDFPKARETASRRDLSSLSPNGSTANGSR